MILWADNFNMYGPGSAGAARMLNGPYAQVQNITLETDPDPTAGGANVPKIPNIDVSSNILPSSTSLFRRVFPAARQTVGFGFRIWIEDLPDATEGNILSFSLRDADNFTQLDFLIGATGVIYVYRGAFIGGSATKVGETPTPVVVANAWQHIEVKATADSLVGEVEIRVEGTTVLTLSGVNTGSVAFAQVAWAFFQQYNNPGQADNAFYIKDLVAWDTTGAYNTNFLGSVGVYTILTDSDESLNWTPSTGSTGWDILDNIPPDDAQYISAGSTPPAPYVGTLTNLPPDVTSVRGVVTVVRARKVDGGDANLQVSLLSDAAQADGVDRPVTTAFTYWTDVFEEDPDTSLAWTPVSVDAARIKINRTL